MPQVSMHTECEITFHSIDDLALLKAMIKIYWTHLLETGEAKAFTDGEEMPDVLAALYDRATTAIEAKRMACHLQDTAELGFLAYPERAYPNHADEESSK